MTDTTQVPKSENTARPSRRPMELVGERQVPEPAGLSQLIAPATTTTPPTPPKPNPQQAEYIHRAAWKAGVLGAINVLVAVVAIRLVLLVAVIGAIYVAMIAIQNPDPWRLGALAIYAVAVVVPTVWLSSRR